MMVKILCIISIFCLIACEKDDEISKARVLWGDWQVNETKIIYDNLKGIRISTTENQFDVSFYHSNNGHISGLENQDFIWAVQDDPDVLIISPELFSVDTMGTVHFNTPELFYISQFSDDKVTLHNEYTTQLDSIAATIERNWVLLPN